MLFKAVLFDLDGTLLDTAPDFILSMNLLLSKYDKPLITESEIRSSVTNGSEGLIKKAFKIDSTHENFAAIKKEYLEIYYENIAVKTTIFDGLELVLDACETHKIPWGIVTNKPIKYTEHLLKKLNLHERSSVIICPEHTKNPKPDPEPLALAAQRVGVKPCDCVYIGDHLRDIQSGNAAGMTTIAAEWGYLEVDTDIEDWRANVIISEPENVFDFIFHKEHP